MGLSRNFKKYKQRLFKRINADIKDMRKHLALLVTPIIIVAVFGTLAIKAPDWHEEYLIYSNGGSIVKILSIDHDNRSGGTGFSLSYRGKDYIVTNSHVCDVVKVKERVIIDFNDSWGIQAISGIIYQDPSKDLCLIRGVPGIPSLSIASNGPDIHDRVYVLGHPLLEPLTLAKGRYVGPVMVDLGEQMMLGDKCDGKIIKQFIFTFCVHSYASYLTTNATYPGNSGSPLLNSTGEVIGVVFASNTLTNKGLVIPLSTLEDFLYDAEDAISDRANRR